MKMKKVLFIAAALGLLTLASTASASPTNYFLGIDNWGDHADALWGALDDWPEWQPGTSEHSIIEGATGSDILTALSTLVSDLEDGDIGIFFYSGAGGFVADGADKDESTATETATDETLVGTSGYVRDDQLADAVSGLASGATLGMIFDSHYAGGMTGGSQDLNNPNNVYVMMATGENQWVYTGDTYRIYTEALIAGIADESDAAADANDDGTVTWDEWFDYTLLAEYPTNQEPENYRGVNFSDRPPVTPEPGTVTLALLAAGAGLFVRRRRKQ